MFSTAMKRLLLPLFALILVSCQKERRIEWHLHMGYKAKVEIEYTGPEGLRYNPKPYDNYYVSYYDKPGEIMSMAIVVKENDTVPLRLTARIDGELVGSFNYSGDTLTTWIFKQKIPKK